MLANRGHTAAESYASSSASSYDQHHRTSQSHSRSASGTSETHYDDPMPTPPPRLLMDEYAMQAEEEDEQRQFVAVTGYDEVKRDRPRMSALLSAHDPMSMHLLLETALADSLDFEVLSPDELDSVKKEEIVLKRRIAAAKRKLYLDMRVRNTAQNVERLDQARRRASGQVDDIPEEQRCNELSLELYRLERRLNEIHDKRMRHTAGVLQLNHDLTLSNGISHTLGGFDPIHTDLTRNMQGSELRQSMFDEDGIMSLGSDDSKVKSRLTELNFTIYKMISESALPPETPHPLPPQELASTEESTQYLQDSLHALTLLHKRELEENDKGFHAHLEEIHDEHSRALQDASDSHDAELRTLQDSHEEQARSIQNTHETHQTELQSLHESHETETRSLRDAQATLLENHQSELQALHETQETELRTLHDSHARALDQSNKAQQTEAMLAGLWEFVSSSQDDMRAAGERLRARPIQEHERGLFDADPLDGELASPHESFSLQAFSAKVQNLCSRATTLSEQQVELRDRMEQERNANNDDERTRGAVADQLQEAHDAHLVAQRKLTDVQAKFNEAKMEHGQVQQEVDFLRQALAERDATLARLQESDATVTAKLSEVEEHYSMLNANLEAAEGRAAAAEETAKGMEAEKEAMETNLVRMQTELTVARAELDGAYGTRAQRAAEVAANPEVKRELGELTAKNGELQKELSELVAEYEGMVKQGIEAEKEREALEGLVDQLRERLEELEVKVGEDKMNTAGRRDSSATQANGDGPTPVREITSMSVMRNEFKKMMREARSEHFRGLRAEQEERRKLEAVIRTLRKQPDHGNGSTLSPSPVKSGLSRSVTPA